MPIISLQFHLNFKIQEAKFSKDGIFGLSEPTHTRLESYEGDQAEELGIPKRISMLEKFKFNSSQDLEAENDESEEEPESPYNIMKFQKKQRQSRLEESKITLLDILLRKFMSWFASCMQYIIRF